jgi:hypothetical protein
MGFATKVNQIEESLREHAYLKPRIISYMSFVKDANQVFILHGENVSSR